MASADTGINTNTPLQGSAHAIDSDTFDTSCFRSVSASVSAPVESSQTKYQTWQRGKIREVFADGGCWANGKKNALAGFRLDFGFGDPRNVCGVPVEGKQTNNRAHASAVLSAVKMTTKNVVVITMSAITVRA